MKIKQQKQLNLQQMIEWIEKNRRYGEVFTSDRYNCVHVNVDGVIEFAGEFYEDLFTVEVEEEITEDTVFPSLAVVRKQYFASGNSTVHVTKINNESINSLIGKQPINSTFEYKEVYLMDDDKLGQCIWRDGKLLEE